VAGQIGGHHGSAAGVALLKRVGDPLVQGDPLLDREPKVDRLAEQVVRKPATAAVGIPDQHASLHGLLDQRRHRRQVGAAHLRENVGQHLIPGHRGDLD
jgi:hypothetical protein